MSQSSARPAELHRYRRELQRVEEHVADAEHAARRSSQAFADACPDGGAVHPPFHAVGAACAALHGLAQRVGQVGDAFLAADQGSSAVAETSDAQLAHVVLQHFPRLAVPGILAPLLPRLATDVAADLRTAAETGRHDLTDLRAGVPATLTADPAFCRAVLAATGTAHLAALVDVVARGQLPGVASTDLVWLADLFARGAGRADGRGPTTVTTDLLADAGGRTAVRTLRAEVDRPLDHATLEAVARATAIEASSWTDGGHPRLAGTDGVDRGDDAILVEAASVPGLALRLLAGTPDGAAGDPRTPDPGTAARITRIVERNGTTSQVGLAALLHAALDDPAARDPSGARTRTGLAVVTGVVTGIARIPHDDGAPAGVRPDLAGLAARVVAGDHRTLVHRTTRGRLATRSERLEELRSVVHHVAGWRPPFDALAAELVVARRTAATEHVAGDPLALALAGRLHGVLAEGAARADVPQRPYDPVLRVAAFGASRAAGARFGRAGGAVAGRGIDVVHRRVSDALAHDPGDAAARLARATASDRDLALAVVDRPPAGATIVWAGSGVADRASLAALGTGRLDHAALDQWLAAQEPPVRAAVAELAAAYRAARAPSP
ncbi:MAG TPA: hypothetical protein VHK88_04915 [Aquihabitans sp.]|nr:hypothetical protein [Aquihabitans sp.]